LGVEVGEALFEFVPDAIERVDLNRKFGDLQLIERSRFVDKAIVQATMVAPQHGANSRTSASVNPTCCNRRMISTRRTSSSANDR
jgi:hypothetical protein